MSRITSAGILDAVTAPAGFDVLVIGSGASGLAAAVSAERAGARTALATKGSIQACNSAKAQGGIQASFGDDDSPEQHAADVWKSSHETADMRLVEALTGDAQSAIHWVEELGVEFTRQNGGYRLARCGGASAKRLLQVGDRTGHAITKALREAFEAGDGTLFANSPLQSLEPAENGWRARCGEHELDATTVVLAAGGRCFKVAEERGELSTNHPNATGEVTQIALALGAGARDLDELQYHPNGGAWPETMQGYSIPETTRAYGAVLLNADGEEFTDSLGPRDVVSQAIFDEVAKGKGVETEDGRPAVYLDTTRIAQDDAEISLPYMLRRYRGAGIDPLEERILTYPVLHYQNGGLVIDTDAETTLDGLYACGEIAGGTHGRNRMMGNSLLECCVFGRRAGRAAAEKCERMTTVTTTDLQQSVEDAAAHLYVWALKDIPQDLRDALAAATLRETSVTGQRVLQTINRNVSIADAEENLVCQDTGIAVYTCRVGEHFPLHPARIYEALRDGTGRATVEHPLRSNAVHTITREHTGPNIGHRLPIVHWEFIADWDGLDVKCVPKGSGSENMSFLKMCVPADGVKGIKQFVLESIVGAGGKPCPPGIVGVGIGGTADYAMYLAKEAITRPVGTRNPDPLVAELEDELYGLLNETGIGPMGLGGDVTVLQCHIEHADTHMTLNPVAVNYQCWAARRASVHVGADGSVEFDREF